MGRVTKKNWVDISASTTLVGFEYSYDLFGNRLTDNHLHRSVDSETYYYDTAQRFTKYDRGAIGGSPTFYQGYTLDDLANWSSFNNNGSTESRTHSVTNEVTVRGGTSLTYDANGNLTDDGNQKYVWDELNRLIQVKDSGNSLIVDYYYNADNLRIEKHHAGGAKEQFYYDGASVLEETDGSQNLVREYVNGGQYVDEVILVANTVGASVTYNYYMSDLRYSVYGFVDSSGAVVERAKYDGYGKRTLMDPSYSIITTPVVDQSYGYTGIRHDNETELQYYRARYFDNNLGRFINRDPIGYVDGLNLYSGYFVNNGLDPFGEKDHKVIKTGNDSIDFAIMDYGLKGTVYWKKVCCNKTNSKSWNVKKNRYISTTTNLKLSGEVEISRKFLKKKTKQIIKKFFGEIISKLVDTALDIAPFEGDITLKGSGTFSAHYDGCIESSKESGEGKIVGEGAAGLGFGVEKHRFGVKIVAEGIMKLKLEIKNKAIHIKGHGGEIILKGRLFYNNTTNIDQEYHKFESKTFVKEKKVYDFR